MKHWLVVSEYKSSVYDMQREKAEDWDSSMAVIAEPGARAGDACILWRPGMGGGVVAIGEITGITVERPVLFSALEGVRKREDRDGTRPSRARADLTFGKLMLSSPVSPGALVEAELGQVVQGARLAGKRAVPWEDAHHWSRRGQRAMPIEMPEAQFHCLTELADRARPPIDWPATWNIPPGYVVQRSKLHEVYGGNRRVWAGPSGATPNAFLFLSADRAAGLSPRWAGDALLAAGHGQWAGSMSGENLGVLAHLRRGIPLRVFMVKGHECLYLGEFAIDVTGPIADWVVTGQKGLGADFFTSGRHIALDVRTPIFRLRQLSGIALPADGATLFRDAPRINLALHPANDHPAATAARELLATLEREPSVAATLGDPERLRLGPPSAQVMPRTQRPSRRISHSFTKLRTTLKV